MSRAADYGRLVPLVPRTPYALVYSAPGVVQPMAVRRGGEGLVAPELTPEARALLTAIARAPSDPYGHQERAARRARSGR